MKMSVLAVAATALASLAGPALAGDDGPSIPFGASVLIIELTEDDIELQVFVDGTDWTRVKVSDPNERRIFDARAKGRLKRQNGMSEMFWASEPTHYLEDDPAFDGTVESFLDRFPEGVYTFEGETRDGRELEGEAMLTHVLPALAEIVSPVSDTDDPPLVETLP